MAIHDYDLPTEPLSRRQPSSFDEARRTQPEFDKATAWAGVLLGAALLTLIAYISIFGPST